VTPRAAFLRAIHDAPDDDAPRLVYADWLDEHGDADRAAFIRVQCALARSAADDPRRPGREAREQELLERHRAEWGGLLGESFSNLDFRRGFLYCTGFYQPPRPLGDEGVRRLLEDCQVAGMILMTLDNCDITDGGLEALAASWQARELQELRLSGNRITARGTEALARSPYLGALKTLVLGGNRLGDAGVAALLAAPSYRLEELDLRRNRLSEKGARSLAASPALSALSSLALDDNEISDAGAVALASSPHFPRSMSVSCFGNRITGVGATALHLRFGDRYD
jgi:uncharacterized protein (TIGR02996 family)